MCSCHLFDLKEDRYFGERQHPKWTNESVNRPRNHIVERIQKSVPWIRPCLE